MRPGSAGFRPRAGFRQEQASIDQVSLSCDVTYTIADDNMAALCQRSALVTRAAEGRARRHARRRLRRRAYSNCWLSEPREGTPPAPPGKDVAGARTNHQDPRR